jgi:hypothetical protein
MTTITVKIDKENDLSAMKELIDRLGLQYQVDDAGDGLYTNEFKKMLDQRYEDYLNGMAEIISEKESRERVKNLLAAQK